MMTFNEKLEEIVCDDGEALCPRCNRVVDAGEMTYANTFRMRPGGRRGSPVRVRCCTDCREKLENK